MLAFSAIAFKKTQPNFLRSGIRLTPPDRQTGADPAKNLLRKSAVHDLAKP